MDTPEQNALQQMQAQAAQQEAARQQANIKIGLELTLGEINTILQILNTGPFSTVLPIINRIIGQSQSQISRAATDPVPMSESAPAPAIKQTAMPNNQFKLPPLS